MVMIVVLACFVGYKQEYGSIHGKSDVEREKESDYISLISQLREKHNR